MVLQLDNCNKDFNSYSIHCLKCTASQLKYVSQDIKTHTGLLNKCTDIQ